jgi:serine/threonine protein kinase/tetratricopeptide (TPR) repeat protein
VTLFEKLSEALSDRYEIERELGRGGMATVYLATDRRHERQVAIKVPDPELASEVTAQRFAREIDIAAHLNHPHILALYDSGQIEGLLYYVMPYVEGESLRERLDRERHLPLEDAVRITTEVAEALDYAHERGVVHRDIKPDNILLTAGGAVVSDFGIARALEEAGGERLTKTGIAVGSPSYMSPEQGDATRPVDGRADQYSLACVLYEMLAGEPPFTGPSSVVVLARHARDPIPPLRSARPTVAMALETAVLRALAKVPADRFATTGEFAKALSAAEARLPEAAAYGTPARGTTARETPESASGRRPIVVVGLAVVVISAIAFGVLSTVGNDAPGLSEPASTEGLDRGLIAVLPFSDQTGDLDLVPLSRLPASEVAAGAAAVDWLDAVPSSRVDALLAETDSSGIDVSEIGVSLGSLWVLTGRVYTRDNLVRFEAELINAPSGTVTPFGTEWPAIEADSAAHDVAQQVLGYLAAEIHQAEYEIETAPRNLAAFHAFEDGIRVFYGDYDMPAAGGHFRRSLEADSMFLDAAMWLGLVAHNMSQFDRADSIHSEVDRFRDRLDTYGRVKLDYRLARTPSSKLREALRLVSLEPTRINIYNAAVAALALNRPGQAVSLLSGEYFDAASWGAAYLVKTMALHLLSRHEEELALAMAGRASQTDSLAEAWMHGRVLVALSAFGDITAIADELDESIRFAPDVTPPPCNLWEAGLELRAHGNPAEADRAFSAAIGWLRTNSPDNVKLWCDLEDSAETAYARVLYDAGQWAEARQHLDRIPETSPTHFWARATSGKAAFKLGDPAMAERVYAELRVQLEGIRTADERYHLASLAAVLGRHEEAFDLLVEAAGHHPRPPSRIWSIQYELHRDIDFEELRDTEPFVEFLKPDDTATTAEEGS